MKIKLFDTKNVKKKCSWIFLGLGTTFGAIISLISLLEPNFIFQSVFLKNLLEFLLLPSYMPIVFFASKIESCIECAVFLFFLFFIIPILFYALLGFLIGYLIDLIRRKMKK